MEEMEKMNIDTRIDGAKAIYDYTHCGEIFSCENCECHKEIYKIKDCENLCEFLRTFTALARSRIEQALNSVL